eukprot:10281039-Alexandrium_andersonii.AAC.1
MLAQLLAYGQLGLSCCCLETTITDRTSSFESVHHKSVLGDVWLQLGLVAGVVGEARECQVGNCRGGARPWVHGPRAPLVQNPWRSACCPRDHPSTVP